MSNVLSPRTLAVRWGVSERHVRNMIARGEIPSFRPGGKLLRIRLTDVEAYECPNGKSNDIEGSSPLSSTEAENVSDIRSELMTRAKLSGLRHRSMRN